MIINNYLTRQSLIMIGGGGHCKSILDTVIRMNLYNKIYVLDSKIEPGTKILNCATVIGGDELLPSLYKRGERNACISVGSIKPSALRSKLYYFAQNVGFNVPNIIDPSALISPFADLGEIESNEQEGAGIFVGKSVIINADTCVGKCSIINTSAIIEHECQIGAFSHISVNVVLCGQVSVGINSFIGAGSVVIQGIKIGNNVTIGAGSLILRNVVDGEKVVGIVK